MFYIYNIREKYNYQSKRLLTPYLNTDIFYNTKNYIESMLYYMCCYIHSIHNGVLMGFGGHK